MLLMHCHFIELEFFSGSQANFHFEAVSTSLPIPNYLPRSLIFIPALILILAWIYASRSNFVY